MALMAGAGVTPSSLVIGQIPLGTGSLATLYEGDIQLPKIFACASCTVHTNTDMNRYLKYITYK
jgi:hypothetical protein